jgi:hypothetical protein
MNEGPWYEYVCPDCAMTVWSESATDEIQCPVDDFTDTVCVPTGRTNTTEQLKARRNG